MSNATLKVPANILLFGEYAVLEEGGLGIATAVEPYLVADFSPHTHFVVEGYAGNEHVSVIPFRAAENNVPFLERVLNSILSQLKITTRDELPSVRICINSDSFFNNTVKFGLGSSAACTVALTSIVYYLTTNRKSKQEIFPIALAAHREAQNGGSGYDVVTSLYGGWGLFTGGTNPQWKSVAVPLSTLALWKHHPVATPHAIACYHRWKNTHTKRHSRYVAESNFLVHALAGVSHWYSAFMYIRELIEISQKLGIEIGVPADIPAALANALSPISSEDYFCKAIGAGDELFCIASRGTSLGVGHPIISTQGLHWCS